MRQLISIIVLRADFAALVFVRNSLTVVMSVLSAGCTSGPLPDLRRSQPLRAECPPRSSADFYFPERVIVTTGSSQQGQEDFFLEAMGAESLSCGSPIGQRYRLMVVHSFGRGATITITGNETVSAARLDAVEFHFAAPTVDNFTIDRQIDRTVSAQEVRELEALIRATGFWNMKPSTPSADHDGATWLLEGQTTENYHAVRRSTAPDPDLNKVGRLLFSMAGILVPFENPPAKPPAP